MATIHGLVGWRLVAGIVLQDGSRTGAVGGIQDSLANRLLDSVVVKSPLPDPLVPIVQWIFQRPGWVMITGLVLGTIVAIGIIGTLWRRRAAFIHWFITRNRGIKILLGSGVGTLLLFLLVSAWKMNHYVMHDNDFCRGCHIFVPSGQAFVRPDTGTYLLVNALEGKHDTLQCHTCHAFELAAQSKELYYWMIERPDKVPPHAKVPRQVCERCHVQGPAKETWRRIASTAGHRTHLESDSLRRRGITCLTCHARSAHRFQPADSTCAQQGCHLTAEVKIKLGKMAGQTGLHCNVCHRFTLDVPQLATRDSAAGTLRPGSRQCFGCHEMRNALATFDPSRDPHRGTCGMCHNPHTQTRPVNALKSCTNANCHGDWQAVDFHTGATHRAVARRCELCHQPHQARVDASDCTGCHKAVEERTRGRIRPPQPFDTLKALRRTSAVTDSAVKMFRYASLHPGPAVGPPDDEWPRGKGDAPPPDGLSVVGRAAGVVQDTFSHERHRALPCLTCHVPNARRAKLTFEPPRGCQICHHQAPAQSRCNRCHQPGGPRQAIPATIAIKVMKPQVDRPRERRVAFAHTTHESIRCLECHTEPVSLAPAAPVRTCTNCHNNHHESGRDCATCHRTTTVLQTHASLPTPHQACTTCHTSTTMARIVPTRSFCLSCHPTSADHYAPRECTVCHFQAPPAAIQSQLTAPGGNR